MMRLGARNVVILSVILLVACAGRGTREAVPRPVRVEPVQPAGAPPGLRYSAAIQPNEQIAVAFKAGGYVREILPRPGADTRRRDLQPGDEVRRGEVLARVDTSDYAPRVGQARAQVAEAEALLEKARTDAERAERLHDSQAITRPDYDAARTQLAAVAARTEAARAQLAAAEQALADCALTAPADAVVLSRRVEVGALAAPGTVGFVIADLTRVKAVFGVPDTLLPRAKVGLTLPVRSDALGVATFPGQITAVSPSADVQSRVFSVEVTIPNRDRRLKAGMIATVEVPPLERDALADVPATVSLAAVVRSPKSCGYAVYVVEGASDVATARAQDVSLGRLAGNRVAVTAGLTPGQRVVVTGAGLLHDGDPVRVIPGTEDDLP